MSDTVDDATTQPAASDDDAASQPSATAAASDAVAEGVAAASDGATASVASGSDAPAQSPVATTGEAVAAAASAAGGGDAWQMNDAHASWIEQICGKNPNAAGAAAGAVSAGAVGDGEADSGGLLGKIGNVVSAVGDAASGVAGAVESAASNVAGAVSGVAGAVADTVGSVASDVGQAVSGAAGTVASGVGTAVEQEGGFLKGMAEGVYDGVKGLAMCMVHGAETVAKEGYALATDPNARAQAVDTVEQGAEAVGGFVATAATDPGKAAGEIVDAASSAASSVGNMAKAAYKSFEEAQAAGHGAEWLGKGVGEAGVLVAGAVLTDGGSLAAEGGAAAVEGASLLTEGAEVAGQLAEAGSLVGGATEAGAVTAEAAATETAAAGGTESAVALTQGASEAGEGTEAATLAPEGAEGTSVAAADSDLEFDPTSDESGAGRFTKTPQEVEQEVTGKFGKDIPKDQMDNSAAKVTHLQDDTTFQAELKKRHPDLENRGYNPKNIRGESHNGQIYINKDTANAGTTYHEQLHHYSNPKFKSAFGKVNGVKFNEGATEYFTRQFYSGARTGHYETEAKVAEAVAKKVGDDVFKKAYFQGDAEAMQKVSDALAGK